MNEKIIDVALIVILVAFVTLVLRRTFGRRATHL
jgi:hypothetical protein